MSRRAHATRYRIAELKTKLRPFKLHWFPTLGSTNTQAARMRREGRLLAPSVILTGRQTAGRGRGANVWHAPGGVITVSFILSAHDTLPPQHVPLIAGLAIRDAIAAAGMAGVGIKWPNDLWHDGRKLAGLLCERFGKVDVIGLGLNSNVDARSLPTAIAGITTSLHRIAAAPVDQTAIVTLIASRLRLALGDARTSLASVREAWQQHDVLLGRRVRVSQEGGTAVDGTAGGIDAGGRLLVRTSGGSVQAVLSGTVRPL